jgi:D-sedoheptulose 7-phosphate isomerase
MAESQTVFQSLASSYLERLNTCFTPEILNKVEHLSNDLFKAWTKKRNVFICGNGGSAANALHLANDFHYGIGSYANEPNIPGLRVEALPSNTAVMTCLANDIGYENIYSHQLEVKANPDDLLILLSGSGNSSNIVNAAIASREIGMCSHAIVAFDGGHCKELIENCIHCSINDMQIAEDTQLIIGHICMQFLCKKKFIK